MSPGFKEVFLNDVFVPDDYIVGHIDGGWIVARATLGNESVSIGNDGFALPIDALIAPYQAHPENQAWRPGGLERIGRYIARQEAAVLLNVRRALTGR